MTTLQPPLFVTASAQPEYTVHCFFGWCSRVVTTHDPKLSHDEMERHFRSVHATDIRRLGY